MRVRVVTLPSLLPGEPLRGWSVVVIDVIRATTTIPRALAAGAREVRICGDLASARAAHEVFVGPKVLAGERDCLRPPGFDLGNSPDEMTPEAVAGRTVFLTTTNGTRAIAAAHDHPTLLRRGDAACFVASLVNARATARRLLRRGQDVLLLCAGSDGELAEEDLTGAGAVLTRLREGNRGDEGAETPSVGGLRVGIEPEGIRCDADQGASEWYQRFEREGVEVLRRTRGGRKLAGAGLGADLDACAAVDACPVVCEVEDGGRRIRSG